MSIKNKPFSSFRLFLDGLKEILTLKFNVRKCSIPTVTKMIKMDVKLTNLIDSLAKIELN